MFKNQDTGHAQKIVLEKEDEQSLIKVEDEDGGKEGEIEVQVVKQKVGTIRSRGHSLHQSFNH
jgi:hypothetical protein